MAGNLLVSEWNEHKLRKSGMPSLRYDTGISSAGWPHEFKGVFSDSTSFLCYKNFFSNKMNFISKISVDVIILLLKILLFHNETI